MLPYPYPPGHYAVLAAVGRVIGHGAGPRGCPGLAAVGAIVVTYPDVAGWFDLGGSPGDER